MQDVQKLPKFYPSYGNLAKKERKKEKGKSWMDAFVSGWRARRTLLSAQMSRFQIFPVWSSSLLSILPNARMSYLDLLSSLLSRFLALPDPSWPGF